MSNRELQSPRAFHLIFPEIIRLNEFQEIFFEIFFKRMFDETHRSGGQTFSNIFLCSPSLPFPSKQGADSLRGTKRVKKGSSLSLNLSATFCSLIKSTRKLNQGENTCLYYSMNLVYVNKKMYCPESFLDFHLHCPCHNIPPPLSFVTKAPQGSKRRRTFFSSR